LLRLKKSPAKDFVSLKRQIQEDERRKNRIQKTNVSRKSRIDGLFEKNHRLTNIRFYYDDLLRFSDYTPVHDKEGKDTLWLMCITQNLNTMK
jgi:hypothetical protein